MEIKISKSAKVCVATERDFVHEDTVYSLVRIMDGELIREDYCEEAWPQADQAKAYSTWTTKFYDPKVAEEENPEEFSPLRQLFYEAVEAEDRKELAKAFLAAQLLRRQRVFKQIKESDESDGEIRITLYSDRIGNRLIEVRDPQFSYTELEAGRTLLLERLQELEAPEEPETVEEDAPTENNVPTTETSLNTEKAPPGEDLESDREEEEYDEDEFDDDDMDEESEDEDE